MRFFAHCDPQYVQKTVQQMCERAGLGDYAVIAGDATGFIQPDAAGNEIYLVREIIMQHAMGEFGVLGNLAKAWTGVAMFRQGQYRGLGKLGPAFSDFVDPLARDPIEPGYLR